MSQPLPEGTVTILFTDVVGSSELRTGKGDAPAQDLLRAHFDLVRQRIEQHSGHEVKTIGDSFMVAFGSARRAVDCAVALQRAFKEQRGGSSDADIQVRIGLNTGEVIREQEDLFGAAVDAAAKITAKAKAGEVLVSEMVRGLVGAAKDRHFVDRGRFRLKGFPERWRLYEVAWQEKQAPTPGAPAIERTPFVGRKKERAELTRLLDQAVAGQGALVLIGGEPGVGKTRLTEELSLEARQRNVLVLIGHCYEMEGAPPYISLIEMLDTAIRAVEPGTLRQALGEEAGEVARLMPQLRRLFPDIPQPLELPPEQERLYLFNSLREFLQRASRAQPLLLVLEDIHWADDSTLLLLEHLAQRLHETPLLMVGTYRDVELDVARPLARTLEQLLRQRLAHDVNLKRLPHAAVAAMLKALSGQEPPVSLGQVIYSETEGNAFFVEEVYKHLAEEGRLFDEDGCWRSNLSVGELEVPRGVRLVIGRRLQRVSEESRRVLTTAAVIGRGFSFELLESLGDAEPDALIDAVDEAERAHLITSDEGPEARFAFTHELIRQTLASGLSLPRRQRLHLRVAESMERLYANALEEHAADVAHHLYQAGTAAAPAKTIHYLIIAFDQALAVAAFEQALKLIDVAMGLQDPGDERMRANLLSRRGAARRSLLQFQEALADWQEAIGLYEKLGETLAVGRLCYDAVWHMGYMGRGPDEMLAVHRRGLTALGDTSNIERVSLLADYGTTLGWAGDYVVGKRAVDEALVLAEELGDQRALGLALFQEAIFDGVLYMKPGQALDTHLRAVELLRAAAAPWDLAEALMWLNINVFLLGLLEEVERVSAELEPLASRVGHVGAVANARIILSLGRLAASGDLDKFDEVIASLVDDWASAGLGWLFATFHALSSRCRGDWDRALDDRKEAVRSLPYRRAGYIGALVGLLHLQTAYMGLGDEAHRLLEEYRDEFPRPGQPNAVGAWEMLFCAVEGLCTLRYKDEVASLYPLTLEAVNTGTVMSWWDGGLVQKVAGVAASCGKQWEKAEEHFEIAMRQAQEIPNRIEQPEVRRWYARMLIDRDAAGDRETARGLLDEAIAMYGKIGMPKHVEMAQTLLAMTQGSVAQKGGSHAAEG